MDPDNFDLRGIKPDVIENVLDILTDFAIERNGESGVYIFGRVFSNAYLVL